MSVRWRSSEFQSALKIGLFSAAVLLIGYLLGARHDYIAYQWNWRDIVAGLDPYLQPGVPSTNAYGPTHNLFAVFYWLNPLLPKLVFIAGWLSVAFFTLLRFEWTPFQKKWLIACLLFNPFFLMLFVSWGLNEGIFATLVFFSVIQMRADKEVSAGILAGLGILLKFVPIVIVPFFWIGNKRDKQRFHHRFFFSCITVVFLGFALSYLKWGSSIFYPLLFADNRPAKMLSIFHFLQGPFSPWEPLSPQTVKLWSRLLIIAVSLVVFVAYLRDNLSRARAVAAELLGVYLSYQVGHQQFHSSVLFLLPVVLWDAQRDRPKEDTTALLKPFIAYAVFLLLYQLAFAGMGQHSAGTTRMNDFIAAPFLIIGGWLFYRLLRPRRQRRR